MKTNSLRKNSAFLQNIYAMILIPQLTQLFKVSLWTKKGRYPVDKKSKFSKENNRPISILLNISKLFERCLYDQMSSYFEDLFAKYQCGFRKADSAQYCLLGIIEKWKIS